MEVDAFLADSAEVVQGKIYALGVGWNTIYTQQFPAVHARMALGIIVQVPYTATNQMHSIAVHLEDPDGNRKQIGLLPGDSGDPEPATQIQGQFNLGRPPLLPAGTAQVVPFAMQFDQLEFENPESYSWVIAIDGTETRRLPIRVALLQ